MERELVWSAIGNLADALEEEAKAWRESVEAERGGRVEEMLEASAVIFLLQEQRLSAYSAVRGLLALNGKYVLARRNAEAGEK